MCWQESDSFEDFPDELVDLTDAFTTSLSFGSRSDLFDWAQATAAQYNTFLIKYRSINTNGKGRLWIRCERSGTYRRTSMGAQTDFDSRKFTGTKKCNCPLELKGVEFRDGSWRLEVKNGTHNHHVGVYAQGHPMGCKLTPEEFLVTSEMTRSQVRPKEILTHLKSKDPSNTSTLKHIYNARAKIRLQESEGRSVMQQLLKVVSDNNWLVWHRFEEGTNSVRDIVFGHPKSVDLLRAFHLVLIMDCTYKTNRYKMPCFEIVGLTPTGHNFVAAFAFLSDEKEESYTWALQQLADLLPDGVPPGVVLTDRELGLMNAIEHVFPHSTHLLCTRHIAKNVESHFTKAAKNKDMGTWFSQNVWHKLV